MKPLVAVIAVLVAIAVGAQAQTPEIDSLRTRAEQGDADVAGHVKVRNSRQASTAVTAVSVSWSVAVSG